MKGFYITVKNGLLDSKHFKAMGGDRDMGTIWLFLWLIDKMTIIDEEIGEGKVLGGRPIKFEEFHKEIPVSDRTYRRWIKMLEKEKYIKTKRAPYGLIITVFKAFKVFGQKTDRSVSEKDREVFNDRSDMSLDDRSNYNNTVENNKDITSRSESDVDSLKLKSSFKEILSYYSTTVDSAMGFKPRIDGGDGSALKKIMKNNTSDDIKDMIDYYLKSDKADKNGVTLKAMLSTHSVNMWQQNKNSRTNKFMYTN